MTGSTGTCTGSLNTRQYKKKFKAMIPRIASSLVRAFGISANLYMPYSQAKNNKI